MDRLRTFYATLGIEQSKEKRGKEEVGFSFLEFASCEQVATVGDELEVKIIHIDRERNKIAGSLVALHPESDPWHGTWQLGVGDVLNATVVRWVDKADRCGGVGGYLLALRPAAFVMLCGQEAGRFKSGDSVAVKVTALDARIRQVTVGLVP